MKIYTKTGDNGSTSLIGGTRVAKDDLSIETFGTLDELNAHLGLLRPMLHHQYDKAFVGSVVKPSCTPPSHAHNFISL